MINQTIECRDLADPDVEIVCQAKQVGIAKARHGAAMKARKCLRAEMAVGKRGICCIYNIVLTVL